MNINNDLNKERNFHATCRRYLTLTILVGGGSASGSLNPQPIKL